MTPLDIVTALAILPGGSSITLAFWAVFIATMWTIRTARRAR